MASTFDMAASKSDPTFTAYPPAPISAVLTAPIAAVVAFNPVLAMLPILPIPSFIPDASRPVSITIFPSANPFHLLSIKQSRRGLYSPVSFMHSSLCWIFNFIYLPAPRAFRFANNNPEIAEIITTFFAFYFLNFNHLLINTVLGLSPLSAPESDLRFYALFRPEFCDTSAWLCKMFFAPETYCC